CLTAAAARGVEVSEPLAWSPSGTRVSHCAPRSGVGVLVPIEKDVLCGEPSAFAQLSLLYSCTVTVGGLGVDPGSVTGLMYSVKVPAPRFVVLAQVGVPPPIDHDVDCHVSPEPTVALTAMATTL